MNKQYLFGGPCDGMIVEVGDRLASLPVLDVAHYSIVGEPQTIDSYELRPYSRRDRRYFVRSRAYPRPKVDDGD